MKQVTTKIAAREIHLDVLYDEPRRFHLTKRGCNPVVWAVWMVVGWPIVQALPEGADTLEASNERYR